MSSNKPGVKGIVQTQRRTWDEDRYRQKAEERMKRESGKGEENRSLPSERVHLTSREDPVYDFQALIGKHSVISDKDPSSGGFYCSLCNVVLRDSISFTDHLNGKSHLARMDTSQFTKRSTLAEVLEVLDSARRSKYPDSPMHDFNESNPFSVSITDDEIADLDPKLP